MPVGLKEDATQFKYNPEKISDEKIREIYATVVENIYNNEATSIVNLCKDGDGKLYIVKINPTESVERRYIKQNYENHISLQAENFPFVMPLLYAETFNAKLNPGCKGANFSITRYIEGQSLEKFKANSLDLATINSIIEQLVEALKALDSKNYVHRDIKPANIFIAKDNNKVYIIDFDTLCNGDPEKKMSCMLLGRENTYRGTYIYARPNSLKTRPYTYRYINDWYSLGLVIQYLAVVSQAQKPDIRGKGESLRLAATLKNIPSIKELEKICISTKQGGRKTRKSRKSRKQMPPRLL